MKNKWMDEADHALLHTYNRYPIVLEKGEGVYLYDTEGKKYLDFAAGIAVCSLGYGHKGYTEALKSQIDLLLHTSNLYYSRPAADAAAKLAKAAQMDRIFFTNSGTEAIEGALKAARKYAYTEGSGKFEIIAMEHSFHGRSMGALSVTATESADGEAFLAGILGHVVGMTAVFNPLVNSYKRLVPGFEAPSDVTWSRTQRNALLHVRKRRGEGVDLELRSPDCAANPYLLLALCLEAGLDGIRKQQKAPKELTEDIRRLSGEEKKQRKIQSLPENLGVALDAMGQDLLVREVLGESYVAEYQKMKRREWKNYLEQVTKWELEQYLYLV